MIECRGQALGQICVHFGFRFIEFFLTYPDLERKGRKVAKRGDGAKKSPRSDKSSESPVTCCHGPIGISKKILQSALFCVRSLIPVSLHCEQKPKSWPVPRVKGMLWEWRKEKKKRQGLTHAVRPAVHDQGLPA